MKIKSIYIHNYRSIIDQKILFDNYALFVGANNAGKSNIINAIRAFYGDLPFSENDLPRVGRVDDESYVDIVYTLTPQEYSSLKDEYKNYDLNSLRLRKYFKHGTKCKSKSSNLYAVLNSKLEVSDDTWRNQVWSAPLKTLILKT